MQEEATMHEAAVDRARVTQVESLYPYICREPWSMVRNVAAVRTRVHLIYVTSRLLWH